jgi:large subunit ribosomal protein L3
MSPEEAEPLELGQEVSIAATFEAGQTVDVTGTSKGRGFTGVVKRWSFSTHGASHGTHEYFRHGGAISAGTYPGRILPGKKMAGQYGNERVTTRGLRVVRVDADRNLLFIRGAVPGHRNGIVRVRPAAG